MLRFFVVLLSLVALPTLVLVHRQVYLTGSSESLHGRVVQALAAPQFEKVKTTMDHLDVVLSGHVPDLPSREKARELVDAVPGVRCQEQDNRIQVDPKLQAKLEGSRLTLSGWVRDQKYLGTLKTWLEEARPGLEVITADVQTSLFVTPESAPGDGELSALQQGLWNAIAMTASLTLLREGDTLRASGDLPAEDLRQAVLEAIQNVRPELKLEATELKAGRYALESAFTDRDTLPEFLRSFYGSPEPGDFSAKGKVIKVSANITETLHKVWEPLLIRLAEGGRVDASFSLFPSTYHFPRFKPVSKLPQEVLIMLQGTLAMNSFIFEEGYAVLGEKEEQLIEDSAKAILLGGPETKVIVGCHPDPAGDLENNAKMARRRAEAVAEKLIQSKVPSANVQVLDFGLAPFPPESNPGRRIEIIVQ
jgi:outer membrane protein OmpA-like peptidoglycan-associated protein